MPQSDQESWWKPRALLKKLLGIEDSAHSIALGTAIGMAVGMTPTVGAQSVIVILLVVLTRRIFHFNRMAALLTIYISNPLTLVPIYYFLYWVGTFFVPGTITQEDVARIVEYNGAAGWWQAIKELFVDVGTPLLIGTAIVAPVSGLLTYPAVYSLLIRFRPGETNVREAEPDAFGKIAEEAGAQQSEVATASADTVPETAPARIVATNDQ